MLLGIDIGGTTTKLGVLNEKMELVAEEKTATQKEYVKAVEELGELVKKYQQRYEIESVGIGVTGVVDPEENKIVLSFSLPQWSGKKLTEDVEKLAKIPVVMENDAVAAAVAEMVLGKGKNQKQLIYVIWGTGVGATVVKRVKGGLVIFPIEMGSQIVDWEGINGKNDPRGRLSTYVGGGEFENVYGAAPYKVEEKSDIWLKVAEKWAQGLINTLVHFPAETVIFGGGFTANEPHVLPLIENCIRERLRVVSAPKLQLATFGEKNGIYGAAILPLQDLSR